ncbi:MAG: MalY/PatB family protein [Enterococcus sp.]
MTNFDQLINRRNTHSVKWDSIETIHHQTDLLPLWIADMDFAAPQAVQTALQEFVSSGIYGYSLFADSLYEAIINWEKRKHQFQLTKQEILFAPGVVPSIATAIQTFSKVNDGILINDPVYHPFATVIRANQRQVIQSPLIFSNDHFGFDFTDFEQKIVDHQVKIFILCNPHNPGGRVWTKAELQQIGLICQRHQVLVISDEIHQDLVFAPHQHVSFQTVAPDFSDFSIVLTAATKTFNLAGVKNSMIFIKNPALRKKFSQQQAKTEQGAINTFGLVATEAAYNYGEVWLTELLAYLEQNITLTCEFLAQKLPHVKVMKPEGTYLIWLDFAAYQLSDRALEKKLINEAGVVLNAGRLFGANGTQHMRLNIACPKAILEQSLHQIAQAFTAE